VRSYAEIFLEELGISTKLETRYPVMAVEFPTFWLRSENAPHSAAIFSQRRLKHRLFEYQVK
jgi:hypothetical protein